MVALQTTPQPRQYHAANWGQALAQMEQAMSITDREDWYHRIMVHTIKTLEYTTANPTVKILHATWSVGPHTIEILDKVALGCGVSWYEASQ